MLSMMKENSYHSVISSIETRNKLDCIHEYKCDRSDRRMLSAESDRRADKAWVSDRTMWMK